MEKQQNSEKKNETSLYCSGKSALWWYLRLRPKGWKGLSHAKGHENSLSRRNTGVGKSLGDWESHEQEGEDKMDWRVIESKTIPTLT